MKRTPLFLIAAVALPWGLPQAVADDYQFIGSETTSWENQSSDRWNQTTPPWDGTPLPGGPGAGDRLDLASEGSLLLPAIVDPGVVTPLTRSLGRLTVSGAGGMASLNSRNNWNATLALSGNIEVLEGRSLQLNDGNNVSWLNIHVGGNVSVGAGAALHLGRISTTSAGTSITDRLTEYVVSGSTIISGTLVNSGGNNTNNSSVLANSTLGDLVVNTGGSVIGAAGGSGSTTTGTRTYHLNARSLSGAGAVHGSSMIQNGTREVNLNLDTVAATDTTFSGVLSDSSVTVADTGINRLHLTLSGPGRQTLSGANTYTGQTRVKNGGTLLVDGIHTQATNGVGGGSATDGLYHVEATATLGGSGTIAGRSTANNTNLVYVAAGGTLAPGSGGLVLDGGNLTGSNAHHLRLDAGAAVSFTLAGNGSSAGHLELWNYAGAGDVVFNNNVVHLSLAGPVVEGTYTVTLARFFSDGGTALAQSGLTGGLTLSGAVFDPGITDAQLFFNNTDITLQYTVVPEPGACALGLFGLGLWAFMRRARSGKSRVRVNRRFVPARNLCATGNEVKSASGVLPHKTPCSAFS
ncbi:MAG TPA: autotransporter-associated beta strand repeat-containing protein [Chthoniobacteraceae bacterium]|nr:autotransporter-associated beta strand repeat-containing protein [Chthoniobacteraceae bacterium]